MDKPIIQKIASVFGVEVREKFKLSLYDEIFMFDGETLVAWDKDSHIWCPVSPLVYKEMVNGIAKVVKLPWVPKDGDKVYTIYSSGDIFYTTYMFFNPSYASHRALFAHGLIFRTEKEAKDYIPEYTKQINDLYNEKTGKAMS